MDTKTLKIYRKRLVEQKTDITRGLSLIHI